MLLHCIDLEVVNVQELHRRILLQLIFQIYYNSNNPIFKYNISNDLTT